MDKLLAHAILGFSILLAACVLINRHRYELVTVTPRGIVVFDTSTGETEVRQLFTLPPTTTTTQPKEES